MSMTDWAEISTPDRLTYILVPGARARVIHHQYQSEHDQRRQGASYYVNVFPWASWGDLAGKLYQWGENRALKTLKDVLPKPKGNQCDCVECVGAVCSDSVHSALREVLLSHEALCGTRTIVANFPLSFNSVTPSALLSIRVHLSPGSSCGLLAYASARRYYNFPHICG